MEGEKEWVNVSAPYLARKYLESVCSVAGEEGPGRSSQQISYSPAVCKSFFPSELATDDEEQAHHQCYL